MRSAGRFALRWASADIRFFVFSNSDFTDYPFFSCTFYKHPLFSPNPFNQKKQLNLYIYIYISKNVCVYIIISLKIPPNTFPQSFHFELTLAKLGSTSTYPGPLAWPLFKVPTWFKLFSPTTGLVGEVAAAAIWKGCKL